MARFIQAIQPVYAAWREGLAGWIACMKQAMTLKRGFHPVPAPGAPEQA